MKDHGYILNRDEWINEAENSEKSENPNTAAAIIRAIISDGVDPDDW